MHFEWSSAVASAAVAIVTGTIGTASAAEPPTTAAVAERFLYRLFVDQADDAYARYARPDYIQHNPEIGNGVDAHDRFLVERAANYPDRYPPIQGWRHVTDTVVVDGDLFGIFHHVYMSPDDPGRVFFDIWRVEDGKIAEHWDVIQSIPTEALNDNTMWCGGATDYASAQGADSLEKPTCGRPSPDASRERTIEVVDRYLAAVGGGDVEAAIREWFADDYRQHSPVIGDGIDGAIDFLADEYGPEVEAAPVVERARTLVQGDLYVAHSYVRQPGDPVGNVQIDMFRVTDGKISEHWDIKQPVSVDTVSGNRMW